CTREARINVNDLGAALARLYHPLKTDRMIFRHRRSHDEDSVGVAQILLRSGRAAAPERSAQTGHCRAVSYTGLIADAHHAQPGTEQFLNQVIFFIVERSA